MDDFLSESLREQRSMERAEDSEREWKRRTEWDEPKYIVKEMMGESYVTFFEDEAQSQAREEMAQDHALDNKF